MSSLVQTGKYGAIKTSGTSKNGYYVIKLISEAYMLQNNTPIHGQIITDGELVVKEKYICSMQENNDCYWYKQPQKQAIIVLTRTILHPRLGVVGITDVQVTPKSVCNRIQEKFIQRHPICLTDADYDYIWYKIDFQEKNWFERTASINSDEE